MLDRIIATTPRAHRILAAALLASVIPLGVGCSNNDGGKNEPLIIAEEDGGTDMAPPADQGGDMTAALPDRCVAGAAWTNAAPAFKNVTDARGLTALDAAGVRISVADVDGDGWADLAIRRASNQAREHDFADGGTRQVWLLRNKGDGTFEDITKKSNILARRDGNTMLGRPAEIFAFADVDNDGDLDAYTTFSNSDDANLHPETAEIMLNNGDGTFALAGDTSAGVRVGGFAFSRGGASFVDANRDGNIDLWVGTGGPGQDLLYLGNGRGDFFDNTMALGLGTRAWSALSDLNGGLAHTNSWGVAACDLNNDGAPELLSASYGRAPNHLWQATGAGDQLGFANRSVASGYAFDHRQDWSDNESARCHCKINPNDEDCAGVPAPTRIQCAAQSDAFRWRHQFDRELFRLGGNSGTTVCADINNDGWLDLLTTEIVHWDVGQNSDPSELLYNRKTAEVSFDRPGNEATGLTREQEVSAWNDGDITAAVFDFDNDGRPDIYIGSTDYPGTRGHLYHQKPDGTFERVPLPVGIDHKSSHGIGIADFDRDGDLDLVIGHSRGRCSSGNHCYEKGHVRMFENVTGANNNWVQLKLDGGAVANRAAIGAQITVKAGDLVQTQEINGGHGHYGIQHDLTAHFGLGAGCTAEVTIRWPNADRTEQTFTVQAGYRYTVTLGEAPQAVMP